MQIWRRGFGQGYRLVYSALSPVHPHRVQHDIQRHGRFSCQKTPSQTTLSRHASVFQTLPIANPVLHRCWLALRRGRSKSPLVAIVEQNIQKVG